MLSESLLETESMMETGLGLSFPILDFFLKSILLISIAIYFEKNLSPFFSSAQKRLLWLTVLVLLTLLPMTSILMQQVLGKFQQVPDLTLVNIVVSPETSELIDTEFPLTTGWPILIAGIYTLGVILNLLRFVVSLKQTAKIRSSTVYDAPGDAVKLLKKHCQRAGINRNVELGSSPIVNSPLTFGTFKPTIVMPSPAFYGDEELLKNILIHEISHIKRLDNLTFLFAFVLVSLNWFNPLVWYALHKLNLESEFACDDEVICHHERRHEFAYQLVTLARSGLDKFDAALASRSIISRGQLTLRVEHILEGNYKSNFGRKHSNLIPLNTLVVLFLFMSTGKLLAINVTDDYGSENLRLVYSELPVYPDEAFERRATGFTQYSFRVKEDGRIDNESIRLLRSDPSFLFEDASITALNSFVFAPRKVNGRLVATSDVHYTFNFDIRI